MKGPSVLPEGTLLRVCTALISGVVQTGSREDVKQTHTHTHTPTHFTAGMGWEFLGFFIGPVKRADESVDVRGRSSRC